MSILYTILIHISEILPGKNPDSAGRTQVSPGFEPDCGAALPLCEVRARRQVRLPDQPRRMLPLARSRGGIPVRCVSERCRETEGGIWLRQRRCMRSCVYFGQLHRRSGYQHSRSGARKAHIRSCRSGGISRFYGCGGPCAVTAGHAGRLCGQLHRLQQRRSRPCVKLFLWMRLTLHCDCRSCGASVQAAASLAAEAKQTLR